MKANGKGDSGEAPQRKATRITSLNAWLRADIAGTVQGVRGGDAAISDDQWWSLCEEAHERRLNWPASR
jgi:hypothetical protein